MLDKNDPEWQQLIDEILSGMAEWQTTGVCVLPRD